MLPFRVLRELIEQKQIRLKHKADNSFSRIMRNSLVLRTPHAFKAGYVSTAVPVGDNNCKVMVPAISYSCFNDQDTCGIDGST
jgi:hypothetical protein